MLRTTLSLCLLLFAAPSAWASCAFDEGYMTSAFGVHIDNVLAVPRDVPVGTALFDSGWRRATGVTIRCDSSGQAQGQLGGGFGAPLSGIPGFGNGEVLDTDIPGVGIQVFWCNYDSKCGSPPVPNESVSLVQKLDWRVFAETYSPRNNWWVRLVKTGPLQAGLHSFAGTATVRYIDLDIGTLSVQGSLATSAPTCRLDTPNLVVQMPTAPLDAFQGPGVLPEPWQKRFDINLQCDAGIRLSYRVDPLSLSAAAVGVMANREGPHMARNVGIQLFHGDGEDAQPLPIMTKLLHTPSTAAGLVRIPLLARYYQISPKVTSGLVTTSATLTLTYE
ncbi:fimbrial protein [Pseudomonas citronellolis]|uniref:fimbrial protein n=1 Tax=Pseudomonas citronellolis TaxID=53408 RepID=UPI000718A4D4|nr:fimbrial protein [Pseudomonas citronellolis]KRV65606.1 hypothetical protein AO742_07005 [Pseudomonas citronellolis]KRW78294.1 hypothetical protein AO738_08350 [Pseudomonas citronellolis]